MEPRELFLLLLLCCDAEATCEPEPRNVTTLRTARAANASPCSQKSPSSQVNTVHSIIKQIFFGPASFPSRKPASSRRKSGAGFRFLTSAKRGSRVANTWTTSNSPDGTLEIYITYLVISLAGAKGSSLKARLWLAEPPATNKISEDVCLSTRKSPPSPFFAAGP